MSINSVYQGASLQDQIGAMLKNLNLVKDKLAREVSKEIVEHCGEAVREGAEKRAPLDTGKLETSIEVKTTYGFTGGGGAGYRGIVSVSSGSAAGKYAGYMHEFFYNLGPKSEQKQSSQSEIVGRKYLERSVNENVPQLSMYIKARLGRFFTNGD